MYSKCPKISNTFIPFISAQILLFMQLYLKKLSGMANSVDPDLGLHCLYIKAFLSEAFAYKILGHLLYVVSA